MRGFLGAQVSRRSPAELASILLENMRGYESTVVAFSGGVDSAVVARAAKEALGEWSIAAISDSPTLPRRELDEAHETAQHIGIRLYAIQRSELDDPEFVDNPLNRCYFCKKGLQEDLMILAEEIQAKTVTYGVNLDDFGDWRPGIDAARERGARFPLADTQMDKQDVRALAKHWGLDVWDKPSSPCLASRVPFGQRVTAEKLKLIEQAEEFVRGLGFRDVRVRHMGDAARVEVPEADVVRLFAIEPFVAERLVNLGFDEVTIDPRGLKSGRLSEEAMASG